MKTKNAWLIHLAEFRKTHPKMPVTDIMKNAKKTYKPKGGK